MPPTIQNLNFDLLICMNGEIVGQFCGWHRSSQICLSQNGEENMSKHSVTTPHSATRSLSKTATLDFNACDIGKTTNTCQALD